MSKGSGTVTDPAVIAELRSLAAKSGGVLRPDDVVEAARPESSAMHGWFTWEDSEAAHKWRVHQARNLLRVTVEYLPSGPADAVRVFVSLGSDQASEGGYRTMVDVMTDDDMQAELLQDALAEMEGFKRKYRRLTKLASVFDAIDNVRKAL